MTTKLVLTFKDPDAVYEAIDDLTDDMKSSCLDPKYFDEKRFREDTIEDLGKWIEWKEYISIEFDLDEGTARVIPNV